MMFLARLQKALCIAFVLPALAACGQSAKKTPSRVLMVGDSLSVGPFGDWVEQYLEVRLGRPNVAVFASCGSSPESWMRAEPDYLTKCGFRENTPERQVVIDYENGHRPPRVRTPKIEDLIAKYRPTTVIVQLGTNWMDPLSTSSAATYEDKFSGILDRFAYSLRSAPGSVRQVIWITPPDASAYSAPVKKTVDSLIRNAAKKYNYQLIISSTMTHYTRGKSGGDGIHYNKDGARPWANQVTKELDRKLR